jgi:gamma-glutamylcysteine synthetase
VNQWTEKQDNVDDKNSHSTNITKTETTAENVELKASKEILLCKKNTGYKICSIAKAKIQETETEEQRLFIHSSWLAVQSPYFRALFYSSGAGCIKT